MNERLLEYQGQVSREVYEIFSDENLRPLMLNAALKEGALLYPLNIGKALRPTLSCLVCECLGGEKRASLLCGAAIELYHNSTLAHDDIIDDDDLRRGKPSVHAYFAKKQGKQYGLSMGILSGDMLQSWTAYILSRLPEFGVSEKVALLLISELSGVSGPKILAGETLDIELPFIDIENVTTQMINEVMENKTAELFRFCAFSGGVIAENGYTPRVKAAEDFAKYSGMAFQLKDDILGITGSEELLGKPIGSDIIEGKRTIILSHAFAHAAATEREFLKTRMGNKDIEDADIEHVKDIFVSTGALMYAEDMADNYLKSASEALNVLPKNPQQEILREMLEYMASRVK